VGCESWVVGRVSAIPIRNLKHVIYIPFMRFHLFQTAVSYQLSLNFHISPENLWCLTKSIFKEGSVRQCCCPLRYVTNRYHDGAQPATLFFERLKNLETDEKRLRTILFTRTTLLWLQWIGYVPISVNWK